MFPLALTLSTLSFVVLAAHYLREGNVLMCTALLGNAAILLFVRRRPVLRTSQFLLVLGAVVWGFTTYELVQRRLAEGGNAVRLGAILGAVIALNVAAAILLGTKPVLARYTPAAEPPKPAS